MGPRLVYGALIPDPEELDRFLAEVCTPAWNGELDAGRPFDEPCAALTAGNQTDDGSGPHLTGAHAMPCLPSPAAAVYRRGMPLQGEYEPSPADWVREQVETYESSNGTEGNTLRDSGLPVIIVTSRGNRSGKLRKTPLMKVEHGGEYALVASKGGAPEHPVWYHNLVADPSAVTVQDGPEPFDVDVHIAEGEERATWWDRAVAAFPPYAEYQTKTDREIPVFITNRR